MMAMSEQLLMPDYGLGIPGGISVLLVLTAITVACVVSAWIFHSSKAPPGDGHYASRDFITHADLVDPEIRRDHLAFNAHLHRRFAGQRFVPVRGEDSCFVAFTHGLCKEVMNDHASFSSNPYSEDRLVALNTMSKADHKRVLHHVHRHYAQAEIGNLKDRIRTVIEQCTDELEHGGVSDNINGGDAMTWAKRIHMASTLTRLGVQWGGSNGKPTWELVDEMVMLNDAMVALVAPLGGVGKRYQTLTLWQMCLVLLFLLKSLPATLVMFWCLGFKCSWAIVRPDITFICPPRHPRGGLWWCPELLPLVPRYFMALHRLLDMAASSGGSGGSPAQPEKDGPLHRIFEGVSKGPHEGGLRMEEALTLLVQLMVNMTSANSLGNMIFRLGTEAEAARQVLAEPDRFVADFVQEGLRLDAPLQRNPRRVTATLGSKWANSSLKPGDQLLLFLGAANMDPAVFEDPTEFRLGRANAGSAVSFGSGMHYCLGSELVKTELRLALECLASRFSAVEVGTYERLVDVDVGNYGFRHLHVQLKR
mmetsp:Transcript_20322/g.36989  ORF Transcript_20322/g.36989 Transcript_20322/m.36989 type:complete len:535 (-) Transcript_20322:103-1707(-)